MDYSDDSRGVVWSNFTITFDGGTTDQFSDKIDFDHPLAALTLLLNEGGATLNSQVTVTLQVTFDDGSTWVDHSQITASLQSSPLTASYDPPNDGFAPKYRLKFSPNATMSSGSIDCKVATAADERTFH